MKALPQILTLAILTSLNVFGQNKLPKNLNQTVKYLDKDCSDSVKIEIKTIHEDSLIYAVYPFAKNEPYKNYKTIFNWTSDENGNTKITKYLESKGIFDYHSEALLYSFRQYLKNGKINEKEILEKFIQQQKKLNEKDKIKFVTDTINGVYIPKNLEECFVQINSFWDESTKVQLKNWDEKEFAGKVHLGFGMWMRNNWSLWGGSRLSKYFNDLGIYHPDDMSGIILVSYHRHLNNKELTLKNKLNIIKIIGIILKKKNLKESKKNFQNINLRTLSNLITTKVTQVKNRKINMMMIFVSLREL